RGGRRGEAADVDGGGVLASVRAARVAEGFHEDTALRVVEQSLSAAALTASAASAVGGAGAAVGIGAVDRAGGGAALSAVWRSTADKNLNVRPQTEQDMETRITRRRLLAVTGGSIIALLPGCQAAPVAWHFLIRLPWDRILAALLSVGQLFVLVRGELNGAEV